MNGYLSRSLAVVFAILPTGGQLIAQSVCRVNPATLFYSRGFSQITVAPDQRTVYIAGQVAQDSAGRVIGAGQFAIQATFAYQNLRRALEAVDVSYADIVKLTTFVVSAAPENLVALRDAKIQAFGDVSPPAHTLAQVAALYRPDIMLELEGVAVSKVPLDCEALKRRVERPAHP